MSMTKEEAIKYGENKLTLLGALGYNDYYAPGECYGYYDEFSFVTAALSALRPITREQVEKVWKPCKVCNGKRTLYQRTNNTKLFMNTFGKAATLVTECNACPPYAKCYMKDISANSAFRINYCPECGRPLTDEAVETIMKRMEEMRND